jgi:DNA-binding transcriptional LysR family regulator
VPSSHPLAESRQVAFEDTLDYEHVGMPPPNAVKVLLQRAAAIAGKPLVYRVIVATFEASLRVVNAELAISVMPLEFATTAVKGLNVKVVPLSNSWAERRFVLCYRQGSSLAPAAQLLFDFLSTISDAPASS